MVRCKTELAVLAVAPIMVQKQTPVAATAISLITSFGPPACRIATSAEVARNVPTLTHPHTTPLPHCLPSASSQEAKFCWIVVLLTHMLR